MAKNIVFILALALVATAEDCGQVQKADIVLLVDESSSIKASDWTKQLQFLSDLVAKLDVGKDKVNIGLICFDHRTRAVFDFKKHGTVAKIQEEINGLEQKRGATRTWDAIKAAGKMFKSARKGVAKILVVLTDGHPNGSQGPALTKIAADAVKKDVTAVAVGVGMSKYDVVLGYIASSPKFVANVNNMADLLSGGFLDVIVKNIKCAAKEAPKAMPQRQRTCKIEKADVVFMVDASASIPRDHFKTNVTKFLVSTVDQLPIGADKVRVGVIMFASAATNVTELTDGISKSKLEKDIDAFKQPYGITNTHMALDQCKRQFQLAKPKRENVQKLAVLVTDGESSQWGETLAAATKLKEKVKNLTFVCIGVGQTNDTQLAGLASSQKLIKHIGDTDQLADEGFIKNEIIKTIQCASEDNKGR